MTKIVDFKTAKAPHDFARKEKKIEDIRARFKSALVETKPKKKKPKNRKRKKK